MEERICKNLRYNLEQMKIAGEKETYMKIVDSIIVGPEIIRKIKIIMFEKVKLILQAC